MRKDNFGQIIASILIAIVAVLLGYFMEPLMAVLGLLISSSILGVVIIEHNRQETGFVEEEEDAETVEA